MGVYNCKNKKELFNSVNSIINQTFEDWELIICNDGSDDNFTKTLLDEIKKLDRRIKCIEYEQNQGLAYALNECINFSNGEFIARQDDDDISNPQRLEKQIKYLENNTNIALVGTNATIYNSTGIWGRMNVPKYPNKRDFLWNSPFIHPSIMIRKNDILSVGGYRVSKETRRCEDYDLFMRMYSMGKKGHNIQEELYQYRVENGENKHRPMKYRIDEAIVRYKGFKKLNILLIGLPYVIKPLIIGLIPQKIFKFIKSKQYS